MGKDPAPMRVLLDEYGRRAGIANANETGYIWAHWGELVGDAIAEHARPTSLREGVLRVRADSPVWATEIGYLATEMRQRINATLRRDLVREIKVWTGPGADPLVPSAPRHARSGSVEHAPEGSSGPIPEDPQTAFERARKAWSRRFRRRAFSGPSEDAKIAENRR